MNAVTPRGQRARFDFRANRAHRARRRPVRHKQRQRNSGGRMSAIRMFSALGVVGALVCARAEAHHSRALYDTTKEVVIEGTVAALEWRNPHISLTVETKSADGTAARRDVEVMSVSEARALGLRPEAIAVGSHVVVNAHPGRAGPTARA